MIGALGRTDDGVQVAEECRRPGVSIASVALANGLSANLHRKWMAEKGMVSRALELAAVASEEFLALSVVATPKRPKARTAASSCATAPQGFAGFLRRKIQPPHDMPSQK